MDHTHLIYTIVPPERSERHRFRHINTHDNSCCTKRDQQVSMYTPGDALWSRSTDCVSTSTAILSYVHENDLHISAVGTGSPVCVEHATCDAERATEATCLEFVEMRAWDMHRLGPKENSSMLEVRGTLQECSHVWKRPGSIRFSYSKCLNSAATTVRGQFGLKDFMCAP